MDGEASEDELRRAFESAVKEIHSDVWQHPALWEMVEEFVKNCNPDLNIYKNLDKYRRTMQARPPAKRPESPAARELKPPKAVNVILSKLEAVREQAEWMGGVDLRVLKKILYDVRERKGLVVEALRLVKEWEKGDRDAFFEDYLNLKSLPEVELEDLGLVGDLERLRRSVAAGSLKPIDVVNILTALYTIYSLTESYLVRFLST